MNFEDEMTYLPFYKTREECCIVSALIAVGETPWVCQWWYLVYFSYHFLLCNIFDLKYKIHGPQIHKFFIKFIYLMTLYVLSFTRGFIFPLANLENHRNKILLHRVLVTFFFLRLLGDIGTSSSTLPWALSKSMKVFE